MKRKVLALIATFTLVAGIGGENVFEAARPDGATLVVELRLGNGLLGGGGWDRVFVSRADYKDVLNGYRDAALAAQGEEGPSGRTGTRFDARDSCVSIRPWSSDADESNFRGILTAENLNMLASTSRAFVETTPDDCDFHG